MSSIYLDKIWANRLIAGEKVWTDVPEAAKQGVTEELALRVITGEITQERMDEIIGA